jgi:hypothetical protein
VPAPNCAAGRIRFCEENEGRTLRENTALSALESRFA